MVAVGMNGASSCAPRKTPELRGRAGCYADRVAAGVAKPSAMTEGRVVRRGGLLFDRAMSQARTRRQLGKFQFSTRQRSDSGSGTMVMRCVWASSVTSSRNESRVSCNRRVTVARASRG